MKSAAYMFEALTGPTSRENENTGFNLALNTHTSISEWFNNSQDDYSTRRFDATKGGAQYNSDYIFSTEGTNISVVLEHSPDTDLGLGWNDLPPRSTIVDVGGGTSPQSLLFAREYPHLNFIVQGHASAIVAAEKV